MTDTGEHVIDSNTEGQNDEDTTWFLRMFILDHGHGFVKKISSQGDLKNYTYVSLSSVDSYVMFAISIILFIRKTSLFIIAHFTFVYVRRNKSRNNGPFCYDTF